MMNQKQIPSLFTLFAVCSSLSFAALEFGYIPSKTAVLPNETLTIQMVNLKGGLTNVLVGAITISDPVGDVTPGTVNAAFSFPFNGDKRDGTSDIWITNVSGSLFGGGTLGVGEILYTFTVTVDGSAVAGDTLVFGDYLGASPFGPGSFTTQWNGVAATFVPLTVMVIPEPATLAVLAIGGLCLRSTCSSRQRRR